MAYPVAIFTVWLGAYLFLVFMCTCVAAGLYYIAELVEEYTKLTKRVISYMIYVVIGIHIAALLVDGLPLLPVSFGIVSHLMYHRMLTSFPYTSLVSTEFLASVGCLFLSHFLWLRFFLYKVRVTLEFLLGFFIVMVWVVPFIFLVSLSANDSVLPGSISPVSSPRSSSYSGELTYSSSDRRKRKATRSSLLELFNFLRRKRDEVLPEFTSRMPMVSHAARQDKVL